MLNIELPGKKKNHSVKATDATWGLVRKANKHASLDFILEVGARLVIDKVDDYYAQNNKRNQRADKRPGGSQ